MLEENNDEIKDYWRSLDTTLLYLPEELIAYDFYLLELAKKDKKPKDEKAAAMRLASKRKIVKRDMEEKGACLKM